MQHEPYTATYLLIRKHSVPRIHMVAGAAGITIRNTRVVAAIGDLNQNVYIYIATAGTTGTIYMLHTCLVVC